MNIINFAKKEIFNRAWMLIFIPLLLTAGCHNHSEDTINIAGNKWLGYQPLFAAHQIANSSHHAKKKHDHKTELQNIAHQVSATILPSTTSVMRVLGNQQLDGAMLTLDEAIQFMDKTGMDICIGLVMDYSNGADALVVNPETYAERSSKRLKIGYEATALGGYMLRRSIEKLGLSAENIKPVLLEPNDQANAFESGLVDGVVTFEPFLSDIKKLGAEVVFSSSDIPNEIIDIMVFKKDSWKTHTKHFDQLINILWTSGVQLIKDNDPEAIKYIQNITGSTEDVTQLFQGIHLVSAEESKKLLKDITGTSIKKMSDYLLNASLILKPSKLTSCQ